MSETSFLGLRTVLCPVDDLQAGKDWYRVASVLDPFGNAFGIIENLHFRLGG